MTQEAQGEGAGAQTLEGDSLLDEILAETKMSPGDEGYEVAKAGVQAASGPPARPPMPPPRQG